MASTHLARSLEIARRVRPLNAFIEELGSISTVKRDTSGLLDGVTFAVKDCFSTASAGTSCASNMLKSYRPPFTATVVERLLEQGCVLVGKSNLDEFSMGSSSTVSAMGPVKNPWTLHMIKSNGDKNIDKLETDWILAGGSSGGSAVAVACGIADIALGSDCGGSSRNPAALCGVVGLKPTYGLLSRYGLVPLVNSLDVPAFITKNVHLAALALDAAAGYDPNDSTSIAKPESSYAESYVKKDIKDVRIGIPKEFFTDAVDGEVASAWNEAALCLRDAGCTVMPISLPHIPMSIVCYHVLGEAEIASNMARYDGVEYGLRNVEWTSFDSLLAANRQTGLGEVVKRRIMAGNYFLLAKNRRQYYEQALKVRRLISQDFTECFKEVDALLLPVTAYEPPWYSQYYSDDRGYFRERTDDYFTQPANMAGLPAISVPIMSSNSGLPISIQIMCPKLGETLLLSLASHLQNSFNFQNFNIDDYMDLLQ